MPGVYNGDVVAAGVSAAGDLYVAGAFRTGAGPVIVDGTLSRDGRINALAVGPNGDLYAAGSFTRIDATPANGVARWDGARWHALGGGVTDGPEGVVSGLLVVGDNLYVGGQFTQAGGKSASRIARWNISTQAWSAVGAGFDGEVKALAFGDGVLYAGGSFNQAGGVTARDVAAWDGARWQALAGDWEIFEVLDSGAEARTFVQALDYTGGELFIGGYFQTIHRKGASTQNKNSYAYIHNVVGYTVASREWFGLGTGGGVGVTTNGFSGFSTSVYALAAVNGGLYIGGTFNRGGGLLTPALARWDLRSGAWSSPGVPSSTGALSVRALAGVGRSLLVGGTFTVMNNLPARSVAVLDTVAGRWDALRGGIGWRSGVARVNAGAIRANAVYLGGELSQAGPHPSLGFARYGGAFGGALPRGGTYSVYLPAVRR